MATKQILGSDKERIRLEEEGLCEDDFKPMLIQTVFWVGNIIGCFVWGFTND